MKDLFDIVSKKCSKITTKEYSTSFSLGIRILDKKLHNPIYSIYGFVRFADEIVDTFHTYCLLYTSPSPRDGLLSRMPSSA